ncbi:MAG: cupin domain-containing protein [Planctomycetes bacterium]|nr:cupin domain-containing protein [Planctomycetota bacterium]
MNKAIVTRAGDHKLLKTDWGQLTWYASREQGNSEVVTVGECRINPGCENPKHLHPNCDEVLVVLVGKISHSIEGENDVEMSQGDSISIPPNVKHNARNIGANEAVLSICFSSADRETVGE